MIYTPDDNAIRSVLSLQADLETGLTIVEEAAVPGHQDHQGSVLSLGLAPLFTIPVSQ